MVKNMQESKEHVTELNKAKTNLKLNAYDYSINGISRMWLTIKLLRFFASTYNICCRKLKENELGQSTVKTWVFEPV